MAVEIATYLVCESGIFCSLLLKWLEYNHEPIHTFFTHVLWTLQSHCENPSILLQGLKSDLPMEHVM